MKAGEASGPLIEQSKRGLGVVIPGDPLRKPDIVPDARGMVGPGSRGMSVAPDDPTRLQQQRRPIWIKFNDLAGDSNDPLWVLDEDDIGARLEFVQGTSDRHGVIQPRELMHVDEFRALLAATLPRWNEITPFDDVVGSKL